MAVDGTKIRAVNANKKMYNKEILEKKCSRIREKLEEYMKETARMDEAAEKEAYEEISEKMKTLRDRKELYQRWRDELMESGETQKLTTDPQAKMMHTAKDGYHCCYNVQTAVSARSKLIVDYKVTNHVNDQGILHDFGKQIQKTIDCQTIHFILQEEPDSKDDSSENCRRSGEAKRENVHFRAPLRDTETIFRGRLCLVQRNKENHRRTGVIISCV